MTLEEYTKNVVLLNCGMVLGTYQKMITQWFGDDFLVKCPDNLLEYFQKVMMAAKQAKDLLIEHKKVENASKKEAEKEVANESPNSCASGSIPQGTTVP